MCEGQLNSNNNMNGNDNNNKKKDDDDERMEDIPLNDSSSSSNSVDKSKKDVPKNNNNNSDEQQLQQQQPEHFPWWCGGGIKPQNGTDLGVWEESLEDRANCVSLWWMSYLNPLLSLGSRKILDAKDVGLTSQQDRAERAYQSAKQAWEEQLVKANAHNAQVRQEWEQEQQQEKLEKERNNNSNNNHLQVTTATGGGGDDDDDAASTDSTKTTTLDGPPEKKLKEPSMSASLVYSFGGWRIALAIFFQVISALLSFVPVLILNDLVGYFEWYNATGGGGGDEGEGRYDGIAPPWVEVMGLGVIPFMVSVLQTRHNAIMAHCGVFVRTAVSTLLYRKALNVSAAGRAKTSTGQVVNMMSNGELVSSAKRNLFCFLFGLVVG